MKRPKVIVICGSTRFIEFMAVAGWLLERDEGAIVMNLHLLPWWYGAEEIPGHLAEHEGCKEHCDNLHMRKIDLADELFVVNPGGYYGNSTRREVAYGQSIGKPVRWYTEDSIGKAVNALLNAAVNDE